MLTDISMVVSLVLELRCAYWTEPLNNTILPHLLVSAFRRFCKIAVNGDQPSRNSPMVIHLNFASVSRDSLVETCDAVQFFELFCRLKAHALVMVSTTSRLEQLEQKIQKKKNRGRFSRGMMKATLVDDPHLNEQRVVRVWSNNAGSHPD